MSDAATPRRTFPLALACAALFALRLAWGWTLLYDAVRTHGVLNTSRDEFLHLRAGLQQALQPLLTLPPTDWQPPGLYTLLGLALRADASDPWWTAAALAIVASAVGTVAAALAARRVASGSSTAFVAGGLLYAGSGLINAVGLVPALPQGLLLPTYAVAIWLCAGAAATPSPSRSLAAALSLSLLPLVRYEALLYALALAGAVYLARPRTLRLKWPLLLVPAPLAALLAFSGLGAFVGRTALLARDTSAAEAGTLGVLAPFRHLLFFSPAIGLLGTVALVVLAIRLRRAGPAPVVALVAAAAPLALLGALFLLGATGAAPYRLVAALAVALCVLGGAFVAELAQGLQGRTRLLALAASLLVLLALDQARFHRRAPHAHESLFRVARAIRESGAEPVVESVPGRRAGHAPMIAALSGRTEPHTLALDAQPAASMERALAGGAALVLLSDDGVAAARQLRPALDLADGPHRIVLLLPRR